LLQLRQRYGDYSIFKMAAAAILDFRNYKFLTAGRVMIASPCVAIGQTIAEILRFLDF